MPKISIAAEKIFSLGSFPVTNSFIMAIGISLFMILLAVWASRLNKKVPGRIQSIFEMTIESILNFGEQVIGDGKLTRKYFPLFATLFIVILFNNWLGILPGIGTIGLNVIREGKKTMIPFLRSADADLNTTFALAIIAVFGSHWIGMRSIGIKKHMGKFLNFTGITAFFVGILELISECSKMISFSFRLFGNMFAGEVLLTIVPSIAPVVCVLPFYFLEIFVGFVQSLVFMMLTLVFIKLAASQH